MLSLYGMPFKSRLLLGTARYPSPDAMAAAVEAARAEIVTVSLRREFAGSRRGGQFHELVRNLGVRVLPNTAGCRSALEAVLTAQMARDLFKTGWVKLEIVGDEDTLQPDVFELVEAAGILCKDGFNVFPYMNADVVVAERLLEAGCRVLMPGAAPIGSAQGVVDPSGLRALRSRFPEVPLIVDAGMGRPSHAAAVMELGCDAVLLNTAVAGAGEPVRMAAAFALAVEAGREGWLAGMLEPRPMAVPSTPLFGRAVFADRAADPPLQTG